MQSAKGLSCQWWLRTRGRHRPHIFGMYAAVIMTVVVIVLVSCSESPVQAQVSKSVLVRQSVDSCISVTVTLRFSGLETYGSRARVALNCGRRVGLRQP